MAFVQVPPDSTGKKVDTNTIGLTERQIAIIGDAVSSSGLAVVTTSAGLMVNVSSGLITLSSGGITQIIPVTSSGVNLYSTLGIITVITGTSGAQVTMTSSGSLPVSITQALVPVGTTGPLLTIVTGTSGAQVTVTSSGSMPVSIYGAVTLSSASLVQLAAQTTGISSFTYVSSSSGNSNNVKGTQGVFYGFYAFNTTQAARYLKVYGTSSAPTVGSTTAQIGNYGIPANGAGGAGAQHVLMPFGIVTTAGVAFTIVSGVEATSTGSIGASDIGLNLYYI